MRFYLFLLIFFFSNVSSAQFNMNFVDASSLAMGSNTTTYSELQMIQGNPATFDKEKKNVKIINIGAQNRYTVGDLNTFQGGFLLKKRENAFALNINYVGITDFQNLQVGLSYGRKILKSVSIGARFHANQLNLGTYGSRTFVDADLGLYSALNSKIAFGFWAKNIIHAPIIAGENRESALHLGFSYTPSNKVILCIEAEKFLNQILSMKGGIEYLPVKNIAFRAGFRSNPSTPSLGLGYISKTIRIDLSASSHLQLGLISALNLTYRF